jgi:bifunctional DNase/RNase
MSLVKLSVNRISYSQSQNGAYALILEEIEGERKLPIVIGGFEAQSIAIALDKEIQPPRPLTHDLFKNLANNYEIKIKQVIIHKLVDGIFFSSIICERDNEEEIFDARTSDAIALALRFESPIYTYDKILDNAGIILKKEISDKNKEKKFYESFKGFSIKDLNKKIAKAIEDENYELAAKLRDEINQRK